MALSLAPFCIDVAANPVTPTQTTPAAQPVQAPAAQPYTCASTAPAQPAAPVQSIQPAKNFRVITAQSDDDDQKSSNTSQFCSNVRPQRVEVRHIESSGIGYNKGYTTIDGFFTLTHLLNTPWTPFMDLRAHVFNDGKPAATAGLGCRYENWSAIWGINAYYDYRNTEHHHYNSIGAGLEALGCWDRWDFRVNGYFPVGRKDSPHYQIRFDKFDGHYMKLYRRHEIAMLGCNAEVGVHFCEYDNYKFYAAAGPYYLERQGKVAWGGEGRVQMYVLDYLRFTVSASYDSVFNGHVQGEFSVIMPFGGPRKIKPQYDYSCDKQTLLSRRALQPVDRFEIIPVSHKHDRKTAINPATGDPYYFVFVNNAAGDANGTIAAPYTDLPTAEANSSPNNILYVFPGNGTYALSTPLVLQQGQDLLGAGLAYDFNTQWGEITVPQQAFSLPVVTSTGAGVDVSVISLVNSDNRVSGLNIIQEHTFSPGDSFFGAIAISGGANYLIKNNWIQANGPTFSSGVSISSNTVATINNNVFTSSKLAEAVGIAITGGGNIVINSNTFTGVPGVSGLQVGVNAFNPIFDTYVDVLNNNFLQTNNVDNAGVSIQMSLASETASSTANIFSRIIGNNIKMTQPQAPITATPSTPNFDNSGINLVVGSPTFAFTGTLTAVLENNKALSTVTPPLMGYLFQNDSYRQQLEVDFRDNLGTVSWNIIPAANPP